MSFPMPDLDPTVTLASESNPRTIFHRVYRQGKDPLTPSTSGNSRYDCPPTSPVKFGVLYLGYDLPTCWMETIVRSNMIRPAGTDIPVATNEVRTRWSCQISSDGPLVLAQFADEALIDLGDSASNIMGDSYLRTRVWSALLNAHANPQVDGLRYRSRFNSGQFCVALFDRAIASKGLRTHDHHSLDPATSREAQSIMRRYKVVPI